MCAIGQVKSIPITMKRQTASISIALALVCFIVLYYSADSDWNHISMNLFSYPLTSQTRIRKPTKMESLQLWEDDKIGDKVDLNNDSNMTSEQLSYFDISCDKVISICKVHIFALTLSHKKKTMGGDIFLLWAEQSGRDGRGVGRVTDNGNGIYSGVITFPWTGETVIKVKLGNTLENFCRRKNAMVKYGNSAFALRLPWGMTATFLNKFEREDTRCGIYNKIQGYPTVCNFTHLNDGSPWFCGKPNNYKLKCEDIIEYNEGNFKRLRGDPYPNSKEVITKFGHGILKQSVTLKRVTKRKYRKGPRESCRTVSKRQSWFQSGGYYLNGKWNIPYCDRMISVTKEAYRTCLVNKTLVFLGDSTVRDYASFFLSETIYMPLIDLKNRKGINNTYHPNSDFKQNGVRIIYKKHELPFHHPHVPIKGVTSLATELLKLARNDMPGDDLIVLFNYNTHMHAYPPDQVRVRLKRIVRALEVLFKEKPSVSVFLRGPHVCFNDNRFFDLRVSLIHKGIIFEEFQHLFDKITYLDAWSITTAFNNEYLHPIHNALNSQIQQFMSYIC